MSNNRKSHLHKVVSCFLFALLMLPNALMAKGLDLGMIDSSPSKMSKRFTPLLKYLSAKGVATGKVVTVKTVGKMIAGFKSGKVDFMFESAFGALKVMDNTGAVAVLIREKKGVKEYNSVIFVPKNSPVQELSDLTGKVVAFEELNSTSSFILPKGILERAGLKLKKSRKPVAGAVAYYFSKDDDNTLVQVKAAKKAHAGGIKKGKVEGDANFRALKPESITVPRHVVVVRKGVDATALIAALKGMRDDPEGRKVLAKIKTKTGFSSSPEELGLMMDTTVRQGLGM